MNLLDVFVAVPNLGERLAATKPANVGFLFAVRAEVVVELRQTGHDRALAPFHRANIQPILFCGFLGLLKVKNLEILADRHNTLKTSVLRVKMAAINNLDFPVCLN